MKNLSNYKIEIKQFNLILKKFFESGCIVYAIEFHILTPKYLIFFCILLVRYSGLYELYGFTEILFERLDASQDLLK